jgi:hypothetical protein
VNFSLVNCDPWSLLKISGWPRRSTRFSASAQNATSILRNTTAPMGISEFRHLEKLPEQIKGTLPTIEEIEAELTSNDEAEPTDE